MVLLAHEPHCLSHGREFANEAFMVLKNVHGLFDDRVPQKSAGMGKRVGEGGLLDEVDDVLEALFEDGRCSAVSKRQTMCA